MMKRLQRYARGFNNRTLQHLARFMPGASSFRIWCHRMRGVTMGKDVWLGYDLVLDTEFPSWISIGNNVEINMRSTIIAHFHNIPLQMKSAEKDRVTVKLEDDVFIGPGVIILPNVTIGRGAAVAAGSVVTKNIPPMTLVQGNPAMPIAKLGIPLAGKVNYKEFLQRLKPYKP